MNAKQFVNKYGIKATAEYTDRNPYMDDERMNHYKVTLRRGRQRMTVYFSMGEALTGEPTAEDVLDCLAMDASYIENTATFEDFCGELGYDTDSRSAERTYKVTQRQSERLERFLGADLYDALLWHTERS